MPRGDGTGPMGSGPRSGRTGYCRAGYLDGTRGGGAGFGRNRGAGWRCGGTGWFRGYGFAEPPAQASRPMDVASTPGSESSQELEALQKENQTLRSELDSIRQRLSELETRAIEAP